MCRGIRYRPLNHSIEYLIFLPGRFLQLLSFARGVCLLVIHYTQSSSNLFNAAENSEVMLVSHKSKGSNGASGAQTFTESKDLFWSIRAGPQVKITLYLTYLTLIDYILSSDII